ncbi:MAG TPA: alkaline phosphatase family protein [Anaerolineales bacterium]|nr:alkaline phosphatase family protein [Anaerolineales bacterium]
MRSVQLFKIVFVCSLFLSACGAIPPAAPAQFPTTNPSAPISADKPCIGAPAPAQWKHIVVLMFENKRYDQVIGPAPYITTLAHKCATALNWTDSNSKVDGSVDGNYKSKPSYATLTNGLSPSAHGLIDDTYTTTTNVDNLYQQLQEAGQSFKDYYGGKAGGCSVRFSGDYHDPIRYYTNVANICDAHDVPLSTFLSDVSSGNLPTFSMILPEKSHTMHDNSISDGDAYAQSILEPLLNSHEYAEGNLAVFFLWDENTPIPNVLLAPSIVPGTQIKVTSGNPISHFSALRTWEEMLGLPLLGDTKQAPSLLRYFDGGSILQ